MLSVNKYPPEYVNACRAKIRAQVAAYKKLATAAKAAPANKSKPLGSAIEAFEPILFNNMVLALDTYFMHRSRTMELKDGNPLNEVRILCNSLTEHDGHLCADKTIKLDPAKSVLKYQVGDEIQLSEKDFTRLADAFLTEIEAKYS